MELDIAYRTPLGAMWLGDALDLLQELEDGSVNLILTSPPFALTFPKSYGNHPEDQYVAWFDAFAVEFKRLLTEDGSLVIDLGGAWMPGKPTRSLYQYRLLIHLADKHGMHLAEDFYWFNRAKLPGPRQWTTVDRVRVKDSVNTLWWLSNSPHPKADNRKVLKPYSKAMLRMIERGTYNAGKRPSEHRVGNNWARDLGGAIPPNVIEVEGSDNVTEDEAVDGVQAGFSEPDNLLDFGNNAANDSYHVFCRSNDLTRHPARFPRQVPEFFIKFLTAENDLVLDPFGGSNVTGWMADSLGRRWISCEIDRDYVAGSLGRFANDRVTVTDALDWLDPEHLLWPEPPASRLL